MVGWRMDLGAVPWVLEYDRGSDLDGRSFGKCSFGRILRLVKAYVITGTCVWECCRSGCWIISEIAEGRTAGMLWDWQLETDGRKYRDYRIQVDRSYRFWYHTRARGNQGCHC